MYYFFLFLLWIGIFLTGMSVLRSGLFYLSGETLTTRLAQVTNKPWKGFVVGILFTSLLQSSSAVMVMTIGLVSAGSLTFGQTIGIILGTNIGSTIITEFMTFSVGQWVIPGIICGAVLFLIPHVLFKSSGMALIGLSAIFAAINGFTRLATPIATYPLIQSFMTEINNHFMLALLVGILLTAIIHSSSAMIGISMGFVASGELTVATAILMMLGSNIGTCITGYMASLGSGKEARFTAYAHIWLNVLGVCAFLPFVEQLEQFSALLATNPATQLAHTSVIFNVVTSIIILPFAKQFATFILLVHKV